MLSLRGFLTKRPTLLLRSFSRSLNQGSGWTETPENEMPPIPTPKKRINESLKDKKARLVYQSRKRGTLENGLLLSTFAAKFLNTMNEKQLELYDDLINIPSNDWDIYYWMIGQKETPSEYNNEVMDMLKEHTANKNMEQRLRQPDLD